MDMSKDPFAAVVLTDDNEFTPDGVFSLVEMTDAFNHLERQLRRLPDELEVHYAVALLHILYGSAAVVVEQLRAALDIAQRRGNVSIVAELYHKLGAAYAWAQLFEPALDAYLAARYLTAQYIGSSLEGFDSDINYAIKRIIENKKAVVEAMSASEVLAESARRKREGLKTFD
jgi:hypothetical protein